MALASHRITIMSRAKGRSSVAAAAYRSGEALTDERTGITYDYTRKRGIAYTAILTPSHAPLWARGRAQLWNSVEHVEKSKHAQLAREIMIALPRELTQTQNSALARAYTQTFVNEGMIADLSIHDKGDGNPHAHIMLTMRALSREGEWLPKCRKEYILDSRGEKIKLPSGEYKSRKIDTVDWNAPEKANIWMHRYEKITNYHLEKAGHLTRICVDSYEQQGVDKIPTKHLGHYAHQLERAGTPSVRGDMNRQIEAENRQLEALDRELAQVQTAQKLEAAALAQARIEAISQENIRQNQARKLEETRKQQEQAQLQAEATKQQELAKQQEEAHRREALMKELEQKVKAQEQKEREKRHIHEEVIKQRKEQEQERKEAEKFRREQWKIERRRQLQSRREVERKEQKFLQASRQGTPAPSLQELAQREEAERRARWEQLMGGDSGRTPQTQKPEKTGIEKLQEMAEHEEAERRVRWEKLMNQESGRTDQPKPEKTGWDKLREQAEREERERRDYWKKRQAELEAERPDWQKLAQTYNERALDWQKLAERAQRQQPEWTEGAKPQPQPSFDELLAQKTKEYYKKQGQEREHEEEEREHSND